MANYWLPKHQELIEKYYWAYTGETSGQTRNECITQLLPVLEYIIRICMNTSGLKQTDDNIQDVLVRIIDYQLPRLRPDKLQGAQNYIYLSTKRYIINKQVLKRHYFISYDDYVSYEHLYNENSDSYDYEFNKTIEYNYCDSTSEADYNQYISDLRYDIMEELDKKIEEQKVINKTNTIFLINMKEYIEQSGCDCRGFNIWIQKKMSISNTTYNSIMSRVGIRSKIFNEKLVEQ